MKKSFLKKFGRALFVVGLLGSAALAQKPAAITEEVSSDLAKRFHGMDKTFLAPLFKSLPAPRCEDMVGSWRQVGWVAPQLTASWLKVLTDVQAPANTFFSINGTCEGGTVALRSQWTVISYLAPTIELKELPELPYVDEPETDFKYEEQEKAYKMIEPLIWLDPVSKTKGFEIYSAKPKDASGPAADLTFVYSCKALTDTKYKFILCKYGYGHKALSGEKYRYFSTTDDSLSGYTVFSDGKISSVTDEIQEETVTSVVKDEPVATTPVRTTQVAPADKPQ